MEKVDLRAGRSNVADLAYARLLNAILAGQLRSGEKLHIESLAADMGISKTPVKEALVRLESHGLVLIDPVRGARVVSPTAPDLDDLYDARQVLEVYGVEKGVPQALEAELRALSEACEEWRVAFADGEYGDYRVLSDLDGRFHQAIVGLAHNKRVACWYEKLSWYFHFLRVNYAATRRLARDRRTVIEHEAIVQACLSRDVGRAREAIATHLARTKEDTVASLCSGLGLALGRRAGEHAPAGKDLS